MTTVEPGCDNPQQPTLNQLTPHLPQPTTEAINDTLHQAHQLAHQAHQLLYDISDFLARWYNIDERIEALARLAGPAIEGHVEPPHPSYGGVDTAADAIRNELGPLDTVTSALEEAVPGVIVDRDARWLTELHRIADGLTRSAP